MTAQQMKETIVREAKALALKRFPEIEGATQGHCLIFNAALCAVANKRGVRLVLQAGTAFWPRVTPETDDGEEANRFGYEWSPDAPFSRARLAAGLLPEIHVWAGDPETQEIADLTTGFFPQQCYDMLRVGWKAPRPPEWFWGTAHDLPDLASYVPNLEATLFAADVLRRALIGE